MCEGEGMKGEPNGGDENQRNQTSLEAPKNLPRLSVSAVCAPEVGTGSNEP